MPEDTHLTPTETTYKKPLVSIVIPVYNVDRYLRQCLESVVYQTYPNLEIIVIDDGSTDHCGDICDEFARKCSQVRVIYTENRGLASARNLGLDHAKGDFLFFLDSDDWIELHTLDMLVTTALKTNADIVTVKSITEYVDQTVLPKPSHEHISVFQGDDILPAYADGLFREVAWNKLYKTKCFTGFRFPDGHNFEDVFLTWRMMKAIAEDAGIVVSLDESPIHFRMRKGSISHTLSFRNISDSWAAYYGRYNGLPAYQEKFIASCFSPIGRMWISYHSFSKEEKERAKEIIRQMQAFSKEAFFSVMKGKYSYRTKILCILSQTRSPFVMWICFWGWKLLQIFRNTKLKMFD